PDHVCSWRLDALCAVPGDQSTMKLMRMLTRHSVTLPSAPVETLISLTQAPLMFFTVLETLCRPCCTASSMPFGDELLSSMTLATDMTHSLCLRRGHYSTGPRGRRQRGCQAPAIAGPAGAGSRGSQRNQSRKTTSASSTISACHRYRWNQSNHMRFHCPR